MSIERIHNKTESDAAIRINNLNTLPFVLCKRGDLEPIEVFMRENPAPFYIIRDKTIADVKKRVGSAKITRENILDYIDDFDKFSIEISSISYAENRRLFGEIMITSDNLLFFIGTDDKTASGREYITESKWNISTDIFDKNLRQIPDFDLMRKFIYENDLLDTVVEFATFDKPIGVNQEKIVVFELRTDY